MKGKEKSKKKSLLGMSEKDFTKENFIEGGLIRPGIMMIAFFSFVIALLLLVFGANAGGVEAYYKWGGSLAIFSFVFNMYSIYQSLTDEPSIFKNLNLTFKFVLLFFEVFILGWVFSLAMPNSIFGMLFG